LRNHRDPISLLSSYKHWTEIVGSEVKRAPVHEDISRHKSLNLPYFCCGLPDHCIYWNKTNKKQKEGWIEKKERETPLYQDY
jgi:hypothetical protein